MKMNVTRIILLFIVVDSLLIQWAAYSRLHAAFLTIQVAEWLVTRERGWSSSQANFLSSPKSKIIFFPDSEGYSGLISADSSAEVISCAALALIRSSTSKIATSRDVKPF